MMMMMMIGVVRGGGLARDPSRSAVSGVADNKQEERGI